MLFKLNPDKNAKKYYIKCNNESKENESLFKSKPMHAAL